LVLIGSVSTLSGIDASLLFVLSQANPIVAPVMGDQCDRAHIDW
jgi:hypothetical protein